MSIFETRSDAIRYLFVLGLWVIGGLLLALSLLVSHLSLLGWLGVGIGVTGIALFVPLVARVTNRGAAEGAPNDRIEAQFTLFSPAALREAAIAVRRRQG